MEVMISFYILEIVDTKERGGRGWRERERAHTLYIIMLTVPWPGTPGSTLCLYLSSALSMAMRASMAAISPAVAPSNDFMMYGAACVAVRQSLGYTFCPLQAVELGMICSMIEIALTSDSFQGLLLAVGAAAAIPTSPQRAAAATTFC